MVQFSDQLKNLKNLWFIIKFNIFTNCYVFIFTFLTLVKAGQIQSIPNIAYEKSCNVITGNIVVDEYLWLIKRATNFLVWQIPIMYIIWPKKKNALTIQVEKLDSGFGYGNTSPSGSYLKSSLNSSNNLYDNLSDCGDGDRNDTATFKLQEEIL